MDSHKQRVANILVLDASNDDFANFEKSFRTIPFERKLVHLDSGSQANDFLNGCGQFPDAKVPDLILLDSLQPGTGGMDLLK